MNKPLRYASLFIICVGVFFFIRWIHSVRQATIQSTGSKISVVATFYPLADFAKNVGGDFVEVTNLTPAGVEPHEYEPTPQDLVKIYKAKVFLLNGNGVDSWADKILPDLQKNGVAVIRRMSDYVSSTSAISGEDPSATLDPHFWLDPQNAVHEVSVITDALILVDNLHTANYTQNKALYTEKLQALDLAYTQGLTSCEQKTFVTSHNAFNYLARRYGLTSQYILGLSPEAEPSAQAVADISRLARENHTKYIFFETLVNPKLAQTIAREIGAQTLILNPIEGLTDVELNAGKDYISEMKENLSNLRIALVCR